eukprot:gene15387-6623_t
MEHCEHHGILINEEHGFREKRSCETQFLLTMEDIARRRDKGKVVDMLILDFSKALDTVPHHRLLMKLENYGIGVETSVGRWIRAWLLVRTQKVIIEGESSETVRVKSGIPQGTVLEPLLFLLFVNDISKNVESSIRLFADDCLLYNEIKNQGNEDRLQNDLYKLEKWAQTWKHDF